MGIDTDAVGRPYAVSSRFQTILGETEATLRGIYGDRFLGLVLFGSHARGTAAPGSDIDLALLLRDCEGVRERRHYSAAIADRSSASPPGTTWPYLGPTPCRQTGCIGVAPASSADYRQLEYTPE